MNSYFSTFFTGFNDIVKTSLMAKLHDVQIEYITDGLVIYRTNATTSEIVQLGFLNNSFVLIKKIDRLSNNSVLDLCNFFIRDSEVGKTVSKNFGNQSLKFRIRACIKNQFVAIDKNILNNLEQRVIRISSKLRIDRSLPDIEFLFNVRSEGFGLIGIQFTHRTNYEKVLAKGELYPELANILCIISNPQPDDIFLDPFAGHGSIPIQRIKIGKCTKIIIGDKDQNLIKQLQQKIPTQDKSIEIRKLDALNLSNIKIHSVNKIVTDPPWGLHETIDPEHFYPKMLMEFIRITISNGIIVLLTSQKELMDNLLVKFHDQLALVTKHDTLVSGKKAAVYKLKRN